MSAGGAPDEIEVRESRPEDVVHAAAASELIDAVADEFDIARRTPAWLARKIETAHAALALKDGELVGFGYWSEWEGGRFVSHSGLVVRPDMHGRGIGRRLKTVLVRSSRRALPQATLMSLTTSPQVKRMNLSLGFRVVPLDRLTKDESFWEGCKTCRNYAEVRARGERCCCEGMILEPPPPPGARSAPDEPARGGMPDEPARGGMPDETARAGMPDEPATEEPAPAPAADEEERPA